MYLSTTRKQGRKASQLTYIVHRPPPHREYLLEVKVRLLEQLSCGFNSPQLAIEFIQMLLDEYTSLTSSLPPLLYLLEPLVHIVSLLESNFVC